MSPNRYRHVLWVAVLLVSTGCAAQNPQASTASLPEGAGDAGFRAIPAVAPGQAPADAQADALPGTNQPVPILAVGKEYRIGPNDLLDIEVLNVENGKRTVRVNAAGAITLPLVGPVTVAGLTQQQAEQHVASLYGEKYLQDPQVSVFIKEFTTERITLDGAVAKPGIYPLVGHMTLLRALALAGGFGRIANATEVKIFRRGDEGQRQVATFDVERIRAGKDEDPVIKGDDLIVVQRDGARAVLRDSIFRDIVDSINPFSVFSR